MRVNDGVCARYARRSLRHAEEVARNATSSPREACLLGWERDPAPPVAREGYSCFVKTPQMSDLPRRDCGSSAVWAERRRSLLDRAAPQGAPALVRGRDLHDTPRDRSWLTVRSIAAIALTGAALLAVGSCGRPADDRPDRSSSDVELSDGSGPKQGGGRRAADEPVHAPWGGLQVAERGNGERAVVMLHGYGSRGDDLVDFATRIEAEVPALYVIPAGPLTNSTGEGRAWFEPALSSQRDEEDRREAAHDVGASRARLDGVVETLFGRGVGRDAVVVAGFSQGGEVAMDLAICGENPIHAVAVFSGAHLPQCKLAASKACAGSSHTELGTTSSRLRTRTVSWRSSNARERSSSTFASTEGTRSRRRFTAASSSGSRARSRSSSSATSASREGRGSRPRVHLPMMVAQPIERERPPGDHRCRGSRRRDFSRRRATRADERSRRSRRIRPQPRARTPARARG